MDRGNVDVKVKQEEQQQNPDFNEYITENGKQYRVPYRIIKQVTYTNLKKEELIDIPHAARLQYRLMLLDPVIKARVDFTKLKITIIYNPRTAENIREKISKEELEDFLAKQGVHVDQSSMKEEDYDYYKNFYSYAYNPPSIRERAPYGYTKEEWQNMKQEWNEKMKVSEMEKQIKFRQFQDQYLEDNPEMAQRIADGYKTIKIEIPKPKQKKKTLMSKIFGEKKEQKEKGFWFHGV